MVVSKQITLSSDGHFNVINVTDRVAEFLRDSQLQNGQVLLFYKHTTGAVLVGEHESGIVADWIDLFERIAPVDYPYKHHIRAVDFNGHAHMRAALMPTQVTIPVIDGRLGLGTYQDILVIDDQVDQEPRYLLLQAIGE